MDFAQAKAWIGAHIQAKGDYLDMVDGGRPQVFAELQADATLESIFSRFAGSYSNKAVIAKVQQEMNIRAGFTPIQHSGRKLHR